MRVSSTQIVYRYQQQLNSAYEEQIRTMEKGDGSKLHRPSDNAVDYSKYLRYTNNDTENLQYQDNVKSGMSWMRTTNATMGNMTDILKTLKEKTVNAATETNEGSDFDDIAKEFKAKMYEIVSLGNTQLGDRYLFSGQSDLVQPFSVSVEEKYRGLAKTLDDPQSVFFNDVDDSGTYSQMLTLEDDSGSLYFLNTQTGKLYSEDFVQEGYKDKKAAGQTHVASGDEAGEITNFAASGFSVSTYFKNTGEAIDQSSATGAGITSAADAPTINVTLSDGSTKDLTFVTVKQPIVSYSGDPKYISMVKRNGVVDQTADTVNVTGQDMNGSDIFDDKNSGNQTALMSDGTVCYASSGTAMMNEMFTVLAKMEEHDSRWMTTDGVTVADKAHFSVINAQTTVAARQNVYESVQSMLETQRVSITTDINDVSSTDVAELAVKLMEAQTIYNMSLSLGARILPQSLADYL